PWPHRDVRPFPARRSSDLDLGGQFAKSLGAVVGAAHQAELVLHQRVADFDDLHAAKSSARIAATPRAVDGSRGVGGAAPTCGAEDRKSTRLNSSHVKISYA